MSSNLAEPTNSTQPVRRSPRARVRGRQIAAHATLLAHGEPMVWLSGGALAVALVMVIGLVGLVLVQGAATFWPTPIFQVRTVDGALYLGEDTRQDRYVPTSDVFEAMQAKVKAYLSTVLAAHKTDSPIDDPVLKQLDPAIVEKALGQRGADSVIPDEALTSLAKQIVDQAKARLAPDGSGVRRSMRTGNFEITQSHFQWVDDFAKIDTQTPDWAMLLERRDNNGRFYGFPDAFLVDGKVATAEPAEIWAKYNEVNGQVQTRWKKRVALATDEIGAIGHRMEEQRLIVIKASLDHGPDSPEYHAAVQHRGEVEAATAEQQQKILEEMKVLDDENNRFQIRLKTVDGQESTQLLSDIVRAIPANRLSLIDKWKVYLSRWGEFFFDDPRNANSEGGVFPAIWGTVAMTLAMTLLVVPFGVLAALYLREYAKAGLLTSAVRISINNLAGVPSIVFGVFGLGFFCYFLGHGVDLLFFPVNAATNSPVFGTGGLMWASFTLALLTLPVVIVATEEALSAVPNSMREGSYACGASKWQTIQRIVLPRALPGIMTGTILAMARGAGEVAPLMLVGVVKMAPDLPVDGVFPFVHAQRSFMHLGFQIYDVGFQSPNAEASKPLVYTTTLLLICIIATLNIAAIWLRGRLRRKFLSVQF